MFYTADCNQCDRSMTGVAYAGFIAYSAAFSRANPSAAYRVYVKWATAAMYSLGDERVRLVLSRVPIGVTGEIDDTRWACSVVPVSNHRFKAPVAAGGPIPVYMPSQEYLRSHYAIAGLRDGCKYVLNRGSYEESGNDNAWPLSVFAEKPMPRSP
jgi:hypothetical protein